MATAADSSVDTTGYYDIVLVGRTGMGKSTTGNKLLEIESTDQIHLRQFSSGGAEFLRVASDGEKKQFGVPSADDEDEQVKSCTKKCELLSNEKTKVRVLDVPGFSDSGELEREAGGHPLTVQQGNLKIVRWMVRSQCLAKLQINRVVYFLPSRGVLEKADGTLQDEIKVIYHYFGEDFFNVMVLAATCAPYEKYQNFGYSAAEEKRSKKSFRLALQHATNGKVPCPPLIYIPLNAKGKEIETMLRGAPVIKDKAIPLQLTQSTCGQCSVKVLYEAKKPIHVVYDNSQIQEYKTSKCHPTFVPRYTRKEKVIGGVMHILTFGIGAGVEHFLGNLGWPFFYNSDEVCPNCRCVPGFKGCCVVGRTIQRVWAAEGGTVEVNHAPSIKSEELPEVLLELMCSSVETSKLLP